MRGVETFNTKSKLMPVTGTFTYKSRQRKLLETGMWIGNELPSFDCEGIAPGARMHAGSTFGPPQFGSMRTPMLSGSMPTGAWVYFACGSC
jgi:hypothetical protein